MGNARVAVDAVAAGSVSGVMVEGLAVTRVAGLAVFARYALLASRAANQDAFCIVAGLAAKAGVSLAGYRIGGSGGRSMASRTGCRHIHSMYRAHGVASGASPMAGGTDGRIQAQIGALMVRAPIATRMQMAGITVPASCNMGVITAWHDPGICELAGVDMADLADAGRRGRTIFNKATIRVKELNVLGYHGTGGIFILNRVANQVTED